MNILIINSREKRYYNMFTSLLRWVRCKLGLCDQCRAGYFCKNNCSEIIKEDKVSTGTWKQKPESGSELEKILKSLEKYN